MAIDQGYFKSYEDPAIHEEMLQDKVRMDGFRRALSNICKDKVVVDVGAGTGILSTMALDFGASQIFAIEYSGIARLAE